MADKTSKKPSARFAATINKKGGPQMFKETLLSAALAALGALIVWVFTHNLLAIGVGALLFVVLFLLFERHRQQRLIEEDIQRRLEHRQDAVLIRRLADQIKELKAVQATLNTEDMRSTIAPILQTLYNVQDFLLGNPEKADSFQLMITQYLPILIDGLRHYERAEEYGFASDSKFVDFLSRMNDGLAEMFRQRFTDAQTPIEIDMEVALDLLRKGGLGDSLEQRAGSQAKEGQTL